MNKNSLEFVIYYLAHNLGRDIEDIKMMETDEFKKWMDYFSIINGANEEEPTEDNNVAGFMHFLQSDKG